MMGDLPAKLGLIGPQQPQANPYQGDIAAVQGQYPLLKQVPFAVTQAPQKPFYSETYLPWSEENPQPGKLDIELRKSAGQTGKPLQDTLVTESFHLLGSTKPDGTPYNPKWYGLKQQLAQSLTPEEKKRSVEHWQQEQQQPGPKRSYDSFMQHSFLDMLVRGYLSPQSQGQEWVDRKKKGGWTKNQQVIFDKMQKMLTGAPE